MLKRPKPLTIATLEDNMVLVKGGSFIMRKPGREVQLKDFLIGRAEVTQALWRKMIEENPSDFTHLNKPVGNVSWYDCIKFCNNLSQKQGLFPAYCIEKKQIDPKNKSEHDDVKWTVSLAKRANGFRLPTEAEWEYAARGGPFWQ